VLKNRSGSGRRDELGKSDLRATTGSKETNKSKETGGLGINVGKEMLEQGLYEEVGIK
jgi:hypothetical protein